MSSLEQKLDELEVLIKGKIKGAIVECHRCKKKGLSHDMIPSASFPKGSKTYYKKTHTCPECFEKEFNAAPESDKVNKADLMPDIDAARAVPKINPVKDVGRPRGTGNAKQAFKAPKSPGIKPPSQKNPVKVAEQLTNPEAKKESIAQAKEGIAFSTRGQWQIKKIDEPMDKGLKNTIAAGLIGASLLSNPAPKAPQPEKVSAPVAEKDAAVAEQPTEATGSF